MRKVLLRGVLFAGAAYGLGAVAGRPWMDAWGSTAGERARRLAGDELVPDAEQQTHAITIEAAPEAVWPWLVQMGQGRAGFYSHDRLERLVGAAIRNAEEIHPEWQHLAVGDLVRTYRPMPRFEPLGWVVGAIEPARLLVVHEPQRAGVINSSCHSCSNATASGRACCRAGASAAAAPPTPRSSGSCSTRRTSSWRRASCTDLRRAQSGGSPR
jgi:hypothetical protein